MSPFVSSIIQILSILTVTAQILTAGIIAVLLLKKKNLIEFIGKHATLFSFIVALIAVLGSLFFSEVAKFTPCKLCWYQRIFMYPEVILLGVALFKKSKDTAAFIVGLATPGAAIAAYNYLLQIGVVPELSCSTTGYSVSCAQRFIMNFGYITIPMMALSAFILIILLQLIQKRYNKNAS